MPIKLLTLSTALVMALSVATFAQSNMINGVDVASDQLERVTAHCRALQAGNSGSAADSSSAAEPATSDRTGAASLDQKVDFNSITEQDVVGTPTGTSAIAGTAAAATTPEPTTSTAEIDLASVDLDACQHSGFISGAQTEVGKP